MLNLKLFMKLAKELVHIAAALFGSNGEKHTKSSCTITVNAKLQIKSCLRNQPRYSVLPFIMLGPVTNSAVKALKQFYVFSIILPRYTAYSSLHFGLVFFLYRKEEVGMVLW